MVYFRKSSRRLKNKEVNRVAFPQCAWTMDMKELSRLLAPVQTLQIDTVHESSLLDNKQQVMRRSTFLPCLRVDDV